MNDIDLLGVIVAAAGHDIAHPGLTNRYLINARDRLAMRYND
jgi:cAMP-specific phosphodiesterase 4